MLHDFDIRNYTWLVNPLLHDQCKAVWPILSVSFKSSGYRIKSCPSKFRSFDFDAKNHDLFY